MAPYKSVKDIFLFQFSHTARMEGRISREEGGPTQEAVDIGFDLINAQPMFVWAFNTKNDEPPTVDQVANVFREGYLHTTDTAVNESYGLLLDTLRQIASTSPTAQVNQYAITENADPSPLADILPIEALKIGTLSNVDDHICMLRMVPVMMFNI